MTETTEVLMAGIRPVRVLKHRAIQMDFTTWEKDYLTGLDRHIAGKVVYDVGAEQGEFSAFVAQRCRAIHLIEPGAHYWPNIKAVFAANSLPTPASCFSGFFSDLTRAQAWPRSNVWPLESNRDIFTSDAFPNLIECPDLDVIRLDDYKMDDPDVLMIDVEGAELRVLNGGHDTIQRSRPVIFMELHSDSLQERFGGSRQKVHEWMQANRYVGEEIHGRHEEHYKFLPA